MAGGISGDKAAGAGAIVAAALASMCCILPLGLGAIGLSGAVVSAFLEPLRPYFLALTAAFLVFGFWLLDREERAACVPGKPCADPAVRRRMKIMLWGATVVAVVFATFPSWQELVL